MLPAMLPREDATGTHTPRGEAGPDLVDAAPIFTRSRTSRLPVIQASWPPAAPSSNLNSTSTTAPASATPQEAETQAPSAPPWDDQLEGAKAAPRGMAPV